MKLLKLNAETQIAELARQAFKLRANASARTVEGAKAALLKANPQLATLDVLPKGTTLVVPVLPGVEAAETAEPAAAPGTVLLEDLAEAVNASQARLNTAMTKTQKETEETLKLVRSRELQALLKQDHPEAAQLLEEIERNAKEQAELEKKQGEDLKAAFTDMQKDLKELMRRLQ